MQNHSVDTRKLDENTLEIPYHALPSLVTPLAHVGSNLQAPEVKETAILQMRVPRVHSYRYTTLILLLTSFDASPNEIFNLPIALTTTAIEINRLPWMVLYAHVKVIGTSLTFTITDLKAV